MFSVIAMSSSRRPNIVQSCSSRVPVLLQQLRPSSGIMMNMMRRRVVRWHGGGGGDDGGGPTTNTTPIDTDTVQITFVQPDDTRRTVTAKIGETLLQTAHRHDIPLEGACEGVCACSTCHLIFPTELYDSLPEPSEDEEDMLDMAFGLTTTSRLGCQIEVSSTFQGMELVLPKATRNFYVDGHAPKPH